jgi:hypothetical protein
VSERKIVVLVVLALILGAGIGALSLELLRPPRPSTVEPVEVEAAEDQTTETGVESSGTVMDGAQPVTPPRPAEAGNDEGVTLDDDDPDDRDNDDTEGVDDGTS